MKTFLLSILTIFITNAAISQCDAPIVQNWTVFDNMNYTINFIPPEGSVSYNIIVSYDYAIVDYIPLEPIIITGNTVDGLNTATINVASFDNTLAGYAFACFTVKLSVICANGDASAINKFYVSPVSLAGDSEIDLGQNYFKPFVPLTNTYVDEPEFIETNLTIPISGFSHNIEDLSVFIDLYLIGFTYNITLVSPEGTSVRLANPQGLNIFFNHGLSVFFKDSAPPFQLDSINYTQGFFSPYDPLSVLEGENPNGVWQLKLIHSPLVNLNTGEYWTMGMLFGFALKINPCFSTMQGKAYFDFNLNGTQELDEPSFANGIIYNSLTDREYMTSSNGQYHMCNPAGEGTISLENPPGYYTANDIEYTLELGGELTNLDFNLTPMEGIEDLKVDIFLISAVRPGFNTNFNIFYENVGTECIDNVEINIELDDLFEITGASISSIPFSGNIATVTIGEVCPGESASFHLYTSVSSSAILNTPVICTATILPFAGDENSIDNFSIDQATVVGSYDPNDKNASNETISPGFVDTDQPLKYLIRFQNTGTYYAERVVIIDTLDASLDINSFSLVTASHDVNITRDGNIYTFEFDQIFLPDSTTNEPESHGFIRYEVKPLAGMADGESIDNTAYIFFDFNAPIITNTVSTVMDFASSIDEITYEAKVYPNPATSEINLEWAPTIQINTIKLFDIAGREIAVFNVRGNERLSIPVSKLNSGIYTFQFEGDVVVKPVVWIKN